MEKEEVLEKLQESARELANKVEQFSYDKVNRLSEFVAIRRAVNFSIQDIIWKCSKSDISEKLTMLHYKIFDEMASNQQLGLISLAELSAVALSALYDYDALIRDYYKGGAK